jgi:hypothetical protein
MKKQSILLLVLAIALMSAPVAMANHCERCRPVSQTCILWPNFGFEICDDIDGCVVQFPCGDHPPQLQAEPLASEFTVAAVERLDGPEPAEDTTRVASLATPSTLNR